jgi:hypothetical protein
MPGRERGQAAYRFFEARGRHGAHDCLHVRVTGRDAHWGREGANEERTETAQQGGTKRSPENVSFHAA